MSRGDIPLAPLHRLELQFFTFSHHHHRVCIRSISISALTAAVGDLRFKEKTCVRRNQSECIRHTRSSDGKRSGPPPTTAAFLEAMRRLELLPSVSQPGHTRRRLSSLTGKDAMASRLHQSPLRPPPRGCAADAQHSSLSSAGG